MNEALLSGLVLLITLFLFAWDKVRHDLVAIIALGACLLLGLVAPGQALEGFSDPAVVVVAAVLIIGRAIELTGVAALLTEKLARLKAPFAVQLGLVLIAGAFLSAFMNNIAALAITMPAVVAVCRAHKLPPGAGLMPIAFATILGGMTTLIGTPANLILSSVRQDQLGEAFGFFDMTAVGATVAAAGLAYLILIGWRLAPRRASDEAVNDSRVVFEVSPRAALVEPAPSGPVFEALTAAGGHVLGVIRDHQRLPAHSVEAVEPWDRIMVTSREDPWVVARKADCSLGARLSSAPDAATARVVAGYGSPLIGRTFGTIAADTDNEVRVIAGGPRVERESVPLGAVRIQPGDQLVLHGGSGALDDYLRYARLLEVERRASVKVSPRRATLAVAIYFAAVAAAVVAGLPTALTFGAAAAGLAALRFLPPREVYSSIDWPAVVLLACMIPVGQSFQTSGAAAIVAEHLGFLLSGATLFWAAAAMTAVTLVLSIFLNNVATAVIMGPVGIAVANALGVAPDALLIAVLIGASSDFLTPIGHQNNLLVMGPGGYRFTDYIRVGWALSVIVVLTSAGVISLLF
ncbi:SLC13 family permease [Brevundimonas sp. 2R-24]|uniref:SLC13 family permease n=1 Tax=Peiella sedimenti TaxID=3061083 RepID=A0ABT8SJQ0_9CAUL|nr:SLC13 family permease [Caulobacteraceae bacterium XZ-24]